MKVKINGLLYEIIEELDGDKVFADKEFEGKPHVMRLGLTEYREQKIYLYKDMSEERKRSVLIHELTHAFIEAYGFYQNEFNEEQLCEFMAIYSNKINKICNKYFNVK